MTDHEIGYGLEADTSLQCFSKKDIIFESLIIQKPRLFEIKRHFKRTRNTESEGELFEST